MTSKNIEVDDIKYEIPLFTTDKIMNNSKVTIIGGNNSGKTTCAIKIIPTDMKKGYIITDNNTKNTYISNLTGYELNISNKINYIDINKYDFIIIDIPLNINKYSLFIKKLLESNKLCIIIQHHPYKMCKYIVNKIDFIYINKDIYPSNYIKLYEHYGYLVGDLKTFKIIVENIVVNFDCLVIAKIKSKYSYYWYNNIITIETIESSDKNDEYVVYNTKNETVIYNDYIDNIIYNKEIDDTKNSDTGGENYINNCIIL
jgi:hypothetical protein